MKWTHWIIIVIFVCVCMFFPLMRQFSFRWKLYYQIDGFSLSLVVSIQSSSDLNFGFSAQIDARNDIRIRWKFPSLEISSKCEWIRSPAVASLFDEFDGRTAIENLENRMEIIVEIDRQTPKFTYIWKKKIWRVKWKRNEQKDAMLKICPLSSQYFSVYFE